MEGARERARMSSTLGSAASCSTFLMSCTVMAAEAAHALQVFRQVPQLKQQRLQSPLKECVQHIGSAASWSTFLMSCIVMAAEAAHP